MGDKLANKKKKKKKEKKKKNVQSRTAGLPGRRQATLSDIKHRLPQKRY